jgi:hypothetical protein
MKVDTYRSKAQPSYGLVVPANTDLNRLAGEVATAVQKLMPLVPSKVNVELTSIATGDLLDHLESQLSEKGAGLMKMNVSFNEVGGS